VPAMMEEPTSPTGAAIRAAICQQPPISVVHLPPVQKKAGGGSGGYGGSATSSAARIVLAMLTPQSGDRSISKRRGLGALAEQVEVECSQPLLKGDTVRLLTDQEVRQRSKKAVDFFRESRDINRRTRTVEEIDQAMTEVRRRRAVEDEKKALEAEKRAKEEVLRAKKGPPKALMTEVKSEKPKVALARRVTVEDPTAASATFLSEETQGEKPRRANGLWREAQGQRLGEAEGRGRSDEQAAGREEGSHSGRPGRRKRPAGATSGQTGKHHRVICA